MPLLTLFIDRAIALQKADDFVERAERELRIARRTRQLVRSGVRTGVLTLTRPGPVQVHYEEPADDLNLFYQACAMARRLTPRDDGA